MERSATFATSPAGLHLGTSFLGYGVGAAIDPVAAPARATIAPDLPLVREQFARHPEDMAKGALIGASLISAALVPGTLFFGGRGAAAAAGPATSGAIRTGGGAAMGFAARTAPITVPEGAILGGAALAAVIGSRAASPAWRSVNIPSGLPDWMDKWNDPHGGAGTGGKEIPRPDWMSGDPEITIDPGVDWRAPGESFQNYLRYRRELPREGPPGTGPTPYYSGPEIARPGAATRSIDSPELFIGGRTFRSPEIKIGAGSRTIHSPEIEVRDPARRFGSELPLRPGRDIFPPELPKSKEYEAFKFPGEWDRRPGVDRFIPELPKTKYADALLAAGSMTIGRGKFRRIPRNVPAPGKIIDGRDTYDLGGLPRDAPVLDVWGETLKVEALKDLSADTVYARMPRGPEVAPRFTIDVFGRPNRLLENLTRTLPDLESGTLTRPDAGTVTKAKTSMGTRTVTVPSITSLVFGSFAPGLTTLNVPEVEYPDPPRLKNPTDYPVDYPPPFEFELPYEFNFLDETRRRRKCKKDGKKRDATATPGSFGFEETLTLPDLSHLWRF
ncbi:MAG: hypothetical protein PHQ24_09320 [Proteiniphilum sp.]|nr:hypothetical protein [Proteiniphilum sp.]